MSSACYAYGLIYVALEQSTGHKMLHVAGGCVQERQALREEVVKLELLLQAQNDKIVSMQ